MHNPSNLVLALVALLAIPAFAANPTTPVVAGNPGYLRSADGTAVISGSGDCWHTSRWTPAAASVVGCDGVMAKAAPVPAPSPPVVETEPEPVAAQPVPPVVIKPEPVSEKVTFDTDTFFDFDKATLKPEGKRKLTELASRLNSMNIEVVLAVGHTDPIGSSRYNQKLSMRRAQSVKEFLQTQSIEPARIYTDGKGELEPLANNKTRDGRAQNRRVEAEVVGVRQR